MNLLIILELFLFSISLGLAADLTVQPKTVGKDVVKAVINKLESSKMFPRDQEMMERIAYAETKFGQTPATYSTDLKGGIWNVDEQIFLETQNGSSNPDLRNIHYKIAMKFKISWSNLEYKDLDVPLYSGIASRLFLQTRPEKIPPTIVEQAKFWKKYYNKNSSTKADNFVKEVKQLQESFVCNPSIDFCFILDGSGSIHPSDFEKARGMITDFVNAMWGEKIRFCLILYGTDVETIFKLDVHDKKYILDEIKKMKQPKSLTNTGGAIERGTQLFNSASQRNGVPKEMFVVTDGQSNRGPDVKTKADEARRNKIIMHAWGIGNDIKRDELLKIADKPEYVEELTGYAELAESVYKLKCEACSSVQKPPLNTVVSDQLKKDEKRYFNYKITASSGITVDVKATSGRSVAYYSSSVVNPSSALNDGNFTGSMQFSKNGQLYIAVEGRDNSNNYTFSAR